MASTKRVHVIDVCFDQGNGKVRYETLFVTQSEHLARAAFMFHEHMMWEKRCQHTPLSKEYLCTRHLRKELDKLNGSQRAKWREIRQLKLDNPDAYEEFIKPYENTHSLGYQHDVDLNGGSKFKNVVEGWVYRPTGKRQVK